MLLLHVGTGLPLKQGCKAWRMHSPASHTKAASPTCLPRSSQRTLVCFSTDSKQPQPPAPLLQADQVPNSCLDYCSSLLPQKAEHEAAACTHKYVMECGPREQECGPRKKNQDVRVSAYGSQMWATDARFCWDLVRSYLE